MYEQRVYKVVKAYKEGVLGSLLSIHDDASEPFLVYPPGEVVYPTIGLLMAFNDLDDARCFMTAQCAATYKNLGLWSAEAEVVANEIPLLRPYHLAGLDYLDREELLKRAWMDELRPHERMTRDPYGTVYCKSIKLLEPLEHSEKEKGRWGISAKP